MRTLVLAATAIAGVIWQCAAVAQQSESTAALGSDNPAAFLAPTDGFDYQTRVVGIPMRDGAKLNTVIVMKKGCQDAPTLLTRTPYGTKRFAARNSPDVRASTGLLMSDYVEDCYILASQDIRGINGSEGEYVTTRPLIGPLNRTTVDESTDAYDTIEWLVHNLPESNGRVGIIGGSYGGFTAAMALIHPHPALKAAVPQSPMVDGWLGDDWFHNGAFRAGMTLDFFYNQANNGGPGPNVPRAGFDDYENFLEAGSAEAFARLGGLDRLPSWRRMTEHPAYDAYWQGQALDRILAREPLKVPTLWVGALWDQEDIYGAVHAYAATEAQDTRNDMNFLVLGPWLHGGGYYVQRSLGLLQWPGDTAAQFRREILKPFLDQRLKTNGRPAATAPVSAFETGTNVWRSLERWPLACETGCPTGLTRLYFQANGALSFSAPAADAAPFDEYISDPARPVPFMPRPIRHDDNMEAWMPWLVNDQRSVDGRTDVLTFVTQPLTSPMKIAGAPLVELHASTSGTDSDWVVKLIDVYPATYSPDPKLGGYELGIAMDIFRGRYRTSFEHPEPLVPGKPLLYRFALPDANHVFLPGHRVMVQVQSSWFPLYDRNPQTFVANIFTAKPGDYRRATQRVFHSKSYPSAIALPLVKP